MSTGDAWWLHQPLGNKQQISVTLALLLVVLAYWHSQWLFTELAIWPIWLLCSLNKNLTLKSQKEWIPMYNGLLSVQNLHYRIFDNYSAHICQLMLPIDMTRYLTYVTNVEFNSISKIINICYKVEFNLISNESQWHLNNSDNTYQSCTALNDSSFVTSYIKMNPIAPR